MPPQKVKTCLHICLVEKKNETVGLPPHIWLKGLWGTHNDIK